MPLVPCTASSILSRSTNLSFRASTARFTPRLSRRPSSSPAPITSRPARYPPWHTLPPSSKLRRATSQSINLLIILLGISLTSGVGYILWTEVFAPSSKTRVFNLVVDRIRSDERCRAALIGDTSSLKDERDGEGTSKGWKEGVTKWYEGDGRTISAFGEGSWSRWARGRNVDSKVLKSRKDDMEEMMMHFYVKGGKGNGTVHVNMWRARQADGLMTEWKYKSLRVDVVKNNGEKEIIWLEGGVGVINKGQNAAGRLAGLLGMK